MKEKEGSETKKITKEEEIEKGGRRSVLVRRSLSFVPSITALKKTRRDQASRFLGLFFAIVWWTFYRSF